MPSLSSKSLTNSILPISIALYKGVLLKKINIKLNENKKIFELH